MKGSDKVIFKLCKCTEISARTILILLLSTLVICTNVNSLAAQNDQNNCEAGDITAFCLIKDAETALNKIDDHFEWATAAAELAIAKNAIGETGQAWTLFKDALTRSLKIDNKKQKEAAVSDISLALSKVKSNDKAVQIINTLQSFADGVETPEKKQDINGKLSTAIALHIDTSVALEKALKLPEGNPTLDSFKARTLREVANQMAKKGEFNKAQETLKHITMGLTYYASMAHSDVAAQAIKKSNNQLASELLEAGLIIARAQENGYFVAGAIRDIGYAYAKKMNTKIASDLFNEAQKGAQSANSFQEKARAMSRIATRMADAWQLPGTEDIIKIAIELANQEEREVFKNFSYYEIAGSAAICGHFDIARSLIEDIPDITFSSTKSLKNSTLRDLAWGLAKHGEIKNAYETAIMIGTDREKVQTLSRIARIIIDKDMNAVARYL